MRRSSLFQKSEISVFDSEQTRLTRRDSVTNPKCRHLLLDAGHIAIESDLADKDAIREIHLKRNQQYSDADYKRLESLMYDKVSFKLEDAQASPNPRDGVSTLISARSSCSEMTWKRVAKL